jgi:hypothetical protein
MIQLSVLEQNYVHPKVFQHELKASKHFNELSDDAIDMMYYLVKNLIPVFNLSDNQKHICILGAFSECIKYWKCYDSQKSKNPFPYFTNVAKRGILKVLKNHEKTGI